MVLPTLRELRLMVPAAGPIIARALRTGQLFRPACELIPPDPDILCEWDVQIPLRDGTRVTANVFRSHDAERTGKCMPVVMCAHPYDNHLIPALGKTPFGGPPHQYRLIPQVGRPRFSTLTSWESPDPNFWVPAGYAVVNMNMPGYANSGGRPSLSMHDQAYAFAQAIDWIGNRDWCTGNVGLSGVSYLAISQFAVAATQTPWGKPAALKAICPWEGITSFYHDLFMEGGVEEQGFPTFWWLTEVKPTINCTQDEFVAIEGQLPYEMAKTHPNYDEYWKAREPHLESIDLPMLVCASFADHGLHTRGSFRAFMRARSRHKWVYTHRNLKWDAYYSDEVQNLTREFFDRFVKGEANGFEERPRVRLEVRSSRDVIHEVRGEPDWPLPDTDYRRLYLTANNSLAAAPVAESRLLEYDARRGHLAFDHVFAEDTEISGYMSLRLWMEAIDDPPPDDMAVFIGIEKLDGSGKVVRFNGCVGNRHDTLARGLIQASRRELDATLSTEWQPVLTGTSEQFLTPGEIVSLEIGILPSSTFFTAGEGLRLIVAPHPVAPSPPFVKVNSCNHGRHAIHLGGQYDSSLLLPYQPRRAA